MNKHELQSAITAVNRYGLLVYSKKDALRFIQQCKNLGVVILGIDAFILTEKTTQPSLENSIDFSSSISSNAEIYERATEFVTSKNESLHFEIICK